MKDYYQVLAVPADAPAAEIKKSYFTLVRKYPPDKRPGEFMRIREAYEVLIDENTRRQYDAVQSLPPVVQTYFNTGRKALANGDGAQAVKLLEEVTKVYPDFSIVNSLLGEAYLKNENSGKAIRIFETLVKQEPSNAGFAGRLAHAYFMRGWHKKAADQYRRALTLDEDNIALWLGLVRCHMEVDDLEEARETLDKALDTSAKNGWDNLELYYHIIQIDLLARDPAGMRSHLAAMKNIAVEKEEEKANVAWFLATLGQKISRIGLYEEAAATIAAASELLPGDEEIAGIKEEFEREYIVLIQLDRLKEDQSLPELFPEMFEFELRECGCLNCQFQRFLFEMTIIVEIAAYRGDIRRLRNLYPELYKIKKDFFQLVLDQRKEEYLFDRYRRKYKEYKHLFPQGPAGALAEDDEDTGPEPAPQPYRRSGPKVGRNDPCPCGSGKKYKKCCGKPA